MRTNVVGPLADTLAGARAEAVLRACVHCGMCNAVCPTFQLTGDELDGPRGRIYLMKGALEGEAAGRETLLHLDRCLECRACETACPSGVEYHRLLDVGRPFVESRVRRSWREAVVRMVLRHVTARPAHFRAALALGRLFGPLLPKGLRAKLPSPTRGGVGGRGLHEKNTAASAPSQAPPTPCLLPSAGRGMIVLAGCVQQVAAPQFNAAATRVFARCGIALTEARGAGCCGAIGFHLGDIPEARAFARRNIDAWLAAGESGAESVVVTASGCAAFIKDYADLLSDDPAYAEKAKRVAALVRDPVEVLESAPPASQRAPNAAKVSVHDPCTLRNGLKLAGRVEALLRRFGYDPQPVRDAHLCCGSAGPYALTQPDFANALRAEKVAALTEPAPDAILTANIGCWLHLSETSPVPVRHWLEAVDDVV